MFGLAKIAASFDARRHKQYWQLMKRLHGGGDEAVSAIQQSGDPHIWHGTRAEKLPQIDREGLKVGPFREFGKGTFFGDRYTAGLYGKPKVVDASHGWNMGSIPNNETGRGISDPEEMVAYLRRHPEETDYKISEGGYVRMALPSELSGTKQLYPKVHQAKVFDMKDGDLSKVAPSQTSYFAKNDPTIKRAVEILYHTVLHGPADKAMNILAPAFNRQEHYMDFRGEKTPEQIEQEVRNHLPSNLAKLRDPDTEKYHRLHYIFELRLGEHLADVLKTPRNERETHQLETYGKLRGRRVFDRMDAPQRKEMFFDHQDIPPELLRHEDGRPLTGQPLQEAPKEEPKPLFEKTDPQQEEPKKKSMFDDDYDWSRWETEDTHAPEEEPEHDVPTDEPEPQEKKKRNLFPLYAGVGTGLAAGGGLAYLAHKKQKERESA